MTTPKPKKLKPIDFDHPFKVRRAEQSVIRAARRYERTGSYPERNALTRDLARLDALTRRPTRRTPQGR